MTIPEIIDATKPVEQAIDKAINAMPTGSEKLIFIGFIRDILDQKRELVINPPQEVKDAG